MPRATIDKAVVNYDSSISFVRDRYVSGLDGADWKSKASSNEAEALYAEKITKAISSKSRQRGINAVSNEDWLNAAKTKGANSIQEGMRQGKDKYNKNFAPVLSAMNNAAASLKPRTVDINTNIDNRVKPVAMAAHNASRRS